MVKFAYRQHEIEAKPTLLVNPSLHIIPKEKHVYLHNLLSQ